MMLSQEMSDYDSRFEISEQSIENSLLLDPGSPLKFMLSKMTSPFFEF